MPNLNRIYHSKAGRIGEWLLLFIILPLITKYFITGLYIVVPLLLVCVYAFVLLIKSVGFDNKKLYEWHVYNWSGAALRFFIIAVAGFAFTYWVYPELFLELPRQKTDRYLLLLGIYPFLSVIPQEVVYRSYYFERYSGLLSEKYLRLSNALSFGFLHIIYGNWVAPILAFLASWIFMSNYLRTRSLPVVCVEHYFYGVLVFTTGLGDFFRLPG